jgi:hypothetical protein
VNLREVRSRLLQVIEQNPLASLGCLA